MSPRLTVPVFDSPYERVLYEQVLLPAAGRYFVIEHHVLVQTVVDVPSGLELDFLVRNRTARPICGFEFDGDWSHFGDQTQIDRDYRKDRLLWRRRVPVHRILPSLLAPEAVAATRKLCRSLMWQAAKARYVRAGSAPLGKAA